MAELVKEYEPEIETFTLIPSDGGRFEITVNDKLIYSKLRTGRHVQEGEVSGLIQRILKEAK
jgi:selenoprotein W-related protein